MSIADSLRRVLRRYWIAVLVVAAVLSLIAFVVHYGTTGPQMGGRFGGPGGPGGGGPGGPGGGPGGPGGPGGGGASIAAVSVAAVSPGDIDVQIPALGTVTTLANVTVRSQISGTLEKVNFVEGQLVKKGDLLAQIDARPYEATLQQAQGNLRHDQALLANARVDLKRYEGLVKEDSVSQQTLDTQRALVDEYIGSIANDEGQVRSAQVNLAYTRIASPVTGRVGLRQVDAGNYVTPGDTNGIVVVNQLQPISVIFSIPEDYVGAIMARLKGGAVMTVSAFDRGNSKKLGEGTLGTVDNSIDTSTGTVKLRALFDNSDGAFFPNQFVNVQLLQEKLKNQLLIPNSAVRRGAPRGVPTAFVFLVQPDHTVTVRPITLGVVDNDRVAVTSGLAAADLVVTEGGDRLRDGARVQLPGSLADSSAAPGGGPPGGRPPGAGGRPLRNRRPSGSAQAADGAPPP